MFVFFEKILILQFPFLMEKPMAKILDGVSRTFGEFLLIPRLTRKDQSSETISLPRQWQRSLEEMTPDLI